MKENEGMRVNELMIEMPNVVSHYIVFEKEQLNLKDFLMKNKIEKQILMKIMCDLSAGIAHLHKNGMAHTAIKLENINVKLENNIFTFQLMNLEFSVHSPNFVVPFDASFHQAQLEENALNLPPEILFSVYSKQNVDYSACDVFSFGSLIYQIILGGINIFEKIDKRDYNPSSLLLNAVPFCSNLNKLLLNSIDPSPTVRYTPKKLLEIMNNIINIPQHNFSK